MTVLRHVHKLKKHTYKNREAIFFCTLGECEYKRNVALSLGKPTICWRCGKTFPINEYTLRLAKPHCSDCTVRKDSIDVERIIPKPAIADDLRSRLIKAIDVVKPSNPMQDEDLL